MKLLKIPQNFWNIKKYHLPLCGMKLFKFFNDIKTININDVATDNYVSTELVGRMTEDCVITYNNPDLNGISNINITWGAYEYREFNRTYTTTYSGPIHEFYNNYQQHRQRIIEDFDALFMPLIPTILLVEIHGGFYNGRRHTQGNVYLFDWQQMVTITYKIYHR